MSSAQTIVVDDTSSSIVYAGSWSVIKNLGAYDHTLHQTTTAGSTNTLTYIGSPTATIFGAVTACDGDLAAPEYQITMDGVTGSLLTVPCNSQFQNGLTVTAQGNGPSGVNSRHVLTVTNLGGSQNLPLMLDYIQYVSYIGESSSNVVQVGPSSTGTASPTAPSSTIASSSGLSASFSSSTTTSKASGSTTGSSPSTGFQTLAPSTIIQLTTINGAATSVEVVVTPTTMVGPNSSSQSFTDGVGVNPAHLIGPVVGGIIGAIIVTLFLVWLYSRRRRMSRSTSALSKRSPESVTPFNLAPNPSPEEAGSSTTRYPPSQVYQLPSIVQPSAQSEQSMEDSTLLYDEKRASGPPFQAWTTSPQLLEVESSSSSLPSSAPPSSTHGRSSSIALSYATVPVYARNPSISRAHYRSGVSAFSISDVPPSYDSVRNADSVPPVPPLDPRYSLQETV